MGDKFLVHGNVEVEPDDGRRQRLTTSLGLKEEQKVLTLLKKATSPESGANWPGWKGRNDSETG